mmetsp:Transcript_7088/g.8169  ORF Transcript_7088/g.8169 Transcript_7088/m.8169 type:complete len:278 (+) Transcript_7088:108-941(+)|eukprot:CAMPEP_0197848794 /NCGR_PEP_ID=MMETSP1438-20131217/10073_1 /TAXON_ID=1461541 /ORGANISM="Pterosperma sp., Strain CCMP1384" /LENGTH=277 /DNA_ID=CAMNT_0043461209 /DNA_START=106 /DNA_END=939 /DNA_ORIENTATION=+
MASLLDKSLDEIIKDRAATKKSTKGGKGGKGGDKAGGKGGKKTGKAVAVPAKGGGNRSQGRALAPAKKAIAKPIRAKPFNKQQNLRMAIENDQWTHDKFNGGGGAFFGGRQQVQNLETGTKLLISNLDFNVSEEDIKELFEELGDVKRSSVHFDRSGRSKGSAEVVYSRRQDAMAALNRYNGVRLDGKAMQIEIASSGIAAGGGDGEGLAMRVANQRSVMVGGKGGGSGIFGGRGRGAGKGAKGGKGGRGGGKGGRASSKSAADLDADMQAYQAMES